jgi:hypothetical protein
MVTMSSDNKSSANGSIPDQVTEFVQGLASLWDRHLGDRLAGVYLIGSLAHGGFSMRYSDIDVAVISQGMSSDVLGLIGGQTARLCPQLAPRLSVFWADEDFSVGRFPPLDRIDYLDHGLPLLERRRLQPERPTLRQVRSYLSGDPLTGWSRMASRLAALAELAPEDHKAYLRAILYPARFLYSWDTGKVASNDDAVAYVENRATPGLNVALIRRALDCRNASQDPSLLFADRLQLSSLIDICARLGRT